MHETSVSYGQLEKLLLSLGFHVQVEANKYRLYQHAPTGAVVSLPDRPGTESVSPTHLMAARTTVCDYQIADEMTFYAGLKNAA